MTSSQQKKDLIVGITVNNNTIQLSTTASKLFNNGAAPQFLQRHKWAEVGKTRMVYVNDEEHHNQLLNTEIVAFTSNISRIVFVCYKIVNDDDASLKGKQVEYSQLLQQFECCTSAEEIERIDAQNRARDASAAGLKVLYDDDRDNTFQVLIDDFDGCAQQAAEAAYLNSYQFYLDEKKKSELKVAELKPLAELLVDQVNTDIQEQWNKGKILAHAQNFAKHLQQLPANYCTPEKFCQLTKDFLIGDNSESASTISVDIHDAQWAKERNMNSFLSVSSGSDEPPFVFEARYMGKKDSDKIDIVLVGKGVTFDSGGISLKPGAGMKLMKSDMGGSSTVVSVFKAIADLKLPLNIIVITMMVENMINGKATRPGDVITASNGKTIEIDNTDAEGRLALADGLVYGSTFKPDYLIDMATLTGAIGVALSDAATGCFTTSNSAWRLLEQAGFEANDFFWRMPIFRSAYKKQLKALSADLNNIGGRPGGACTAATFLAEFVDHTAVKHFVHLDIAEVVIPEASGECGTGRSTPSVVRFAELISKQQ